MDFKGNLDRVRRSIVEAKSMGATYRVGPELELPGYGCEDHFCELDTVEHAWECLRELLHEGYTDGIVCDIGMPVIHAGVRYNCRVFVYNQKIVFIQPKRELANDGNYREGRYFSAWQRPGEVDEHWLPLEISGLTDQKTCPFGDAILAFNDAIIASETCEELFTPNAPHIGLSLGGVEVISNGSGSHHQLRKLDTRLDLIMNATAKCGGVYLYSNQRGCDGGRLYYDGCACIAMNGKLLAQGSQFGLDDVEVITACVDLDEVVSMRCAVSSVRDQAARCKAPISIHVDFYLCNSHSKAIRTTQPIQPRIHAPEEELAYGPACWLWDYLRRSGASGYLLPLSGGADSSSTAAIVGCMCQMVVKAVGSGNLEVEEDARRIGQYGPGEPIDNARELAQRIFTTLYLGTVNSSEETRLRSKMLAEQIGSYHLQMRIDMLVEAVVRLFTMVTNKTPRFVTDGGTRAENLALQNIQARLRMVVSFLFAQLLPWVRGRSGFMLVLGSANVDEGLRGYLTKYDCSSADINPIGGISKQDIRRFLQWAAGNLGYPVLEQVEAAPPTAELEPLRDGQIAQTDEEDMGMTYEELSMFGRLRKISRCGPVSMFRQLLQQWSHAYPAAAIADKVKHFFTHYAMNRHKATTLTPSYHAENYSPDDNRFDHRQFLYNVRWPWQFSRIDDVLAEQPSPVEGSWDCRNGIGSVSES
ncbi:unnamed protein product [Ostreobium quekettii]|uniref:Glutamine-dependent NAD(+) synthetase n=1 Tax=Ostreobium quekettii TaxID=121088 RepID=A0A8S1IQ45_9CHLO|nr:unnamed protein product [Ostreobium quekettii]